MAIAKNDVFIFLLGWLLMGGNKNLVGRRWMSKFLVGGGDSPIPPVGKTFKLCQQVLYTMKQLHAHHIHHVRKWPSYFWKIWALGVWQIYMIYIFSCLFIVCNTRNLSHQVSLKRVSLISFESKNHLRT